MTDPIKTVLFLLTATNGDYSERRTNVLGYYLDKRQADYARDRLHDNNLAAVALHDRLAVLMREYAEEQEPLRRETYSYEERAEAETINQRLDAAYEKKRVYYSKMLGIDPFVCEPHDRIYFEVEEVLPGKSPYDSDFIPSKG